MFSLFNGIYDSYLAPSQLNLLVVGAPESGKTTLLERLKVTEIPSRPSTGSGGSKTVQQRIAVEDLPYAVRSALLETGAMEGTRARTRTLSKNSLASGSSSNNITLKAGASSSPSQRPTPSAPATSETPNVKTITGESLVVTQKKRFSFCPAPQRYSRSSQVQDDEVIVDDDEEMEHLLLNDMGGGGGGGDGNPLARGASIFRDDSFSSQPPPLRTRSHSKEFDVDDTLDLVTDGMENVDLTSDREIGQSAEMSMSSIAVDNEHPILAVTNKALRPRPAAPPQPHPLLEEPNEGPAMLQSSSEEYNVKPNTKILPLRMIRPTIGTNLAKIDMYGAKCHIFDVGGKMKALWERYYEDCDAVIFCWKLGEDPDKPPKEIDSDDDTDAEEEDIHETIYKKQQELLDTVRKSIPDDVPFLILGHVFGKANSEIVDTMYNTDLLLPRYHNPMTGFCCSSAKTGAGVQSAMEWLIPLAKRQQKERINSKRELNILLEEQGKTL